jgi:hypothetical protein
VNFVVTIKFSTHSFLCKLKQVIDSKLVVDGSIEEYQDKVVGFSQKEGINLDEIHVLVTIGFF